MPNERNGTTEANDAIREELDRLHQFADSKKVEIDTQLASMRETATSLQQIVDQAKSLLSELTTQQTAFQEAGKQAIETKAQATASLESLRTFLTTATENANRIEAIKATAEQTQSVIATKSEHIEGGRTHADDVRAKIDRLFTEAQQSATSAEAQHQAVRVTAENVSSLYASAQTTKANTEADASSVSKLLQQCNEHAATTKKLSDIAESTQQKITEYETRLQNLESAAEDRLKTIESLLPGASSAGLASAFNFRREHFKWPQRIWTCVFILCLFALAGIAWYDFSLFTGTPTHASWENMGLSLLHRLPFVLPIIWLAFHASHKAAIAQRVEEDYAFKETVSRSFEGYRREMAELEGKAQPQSVLSRLCEGVLSVITNPPGRLYERHMLNKTPLNALAESAGPIADAASKLTTPTVRVGR